MVYKINNQIWKIRLVGKDSTALYRSDGSFALGMCDGNTHTIYVYEPLKKGMSLLRKVITHEVAHSAMFAYGISMSIEQEEMFCDLIATFGDEIFEIVDGFFSGLNRSLA